MLSNVDFHQQQEQILNQQSRTRTRDSFALNKDGNVAVSNFEFWNDHMSECPRGVKLQLLGEGGVAAYGVYNGDRFWVKWAPLPRVRKAGQPYADSTPELSVGFSSFESWFQGQPFAGRDSGNLKQVARDAYAAGMGDPLVMAKSDPLKDHEIAQLVNELVAAMMRCEGTQQLRQCISQLVGPALKAKAQQEIISYQFQGIDGAWCDFIDEKHKDWSIADGRRPIRALCVHSHITPKDPS